MISTYVLNNYLNQDPISPCSEFNEKIKDFLHKKKEESSLSGVFYTYYSKTNEYAHHVKIGFISEKEISDVDKLKNEIKDLLDDNLKKQGDMIQGPLYLPCKANALTGLIACHSFELLKFVAGKNNEQISDTYHAVISWCVKNIPILNKIILEKFPYLLTLNLSLKEDEQLTAFCSNFKKDILDNTEDFPKSFWFIIERLFHHCNNSNQKFGDNENEIFNTLINKIQTDNSLNFSTIISSAKVSNSQYFNKFPYHPHLT